MSSAVARAGPREQLRRLARNLSSTLSYQTGLGIFRIYTGHCMIPVLGMLPDSVEGWLEKPAR